MHQSQINIEITLDDQKMPEEINWIAPDGGVENRQAAKAMLLSIWDGGEKNALRIDLWTKQMMVDEMNDFFYQTFFGMADTYARATRNNELAESMKEFARSFHRQAQESLQQQNQS